MNVTSASAVQGTPRGLDSSLMEAVGELILTMQATGGKAVRLNPRKFETLAKDGVWQFLMSNYTSWNWEYDETQDDSPYTEESMEYAWRLMLSSIQAHTGLSEEEVVTFARTLMEVLDMGDEFETPDGFIKSAEDVDEVFGGPMKRIDRYQDKARRVLVTVLALLLVDDGKLSGRLLSS